MTDQTAAMVRRLRQTACENIAYDFALSDSLGASKSGCNFLPHAANDGRHSAIAKWLTQSATRAHCWEELGVD